MQVEIRPPLFSRYPIPPDEWWSRAQANDLWATHTLFSMHSALTLTGYTVLARIVDFKRSVPCTRGLTQLGSS